MASVLTGITLLFAAAWALTALLHGQSAAARHLVWTCALAGSLLLPALRFTAPKQPVHPPVALAVIAVESGPAELPGDGRDPAKTALFLWLAGIAAGALRLLVSMRVLRGILQRATLAGHCGPLPILSSAEIRGPVVTGIARAVILLPESASQWTPSRRRAVLLHEIAHVRRHDAVTLLLARIATIVWWFHPLCWLAAGRLRAESERACDDRALRSGLRPSVYAGHLLELARRFHLSPAIPMANTAHLETRVKSILDPFTNRTATARRTWFVAAILTSATLTPLATLALHAQGVGTVIGSVSDPSGARIPNAQVVVISAGGGNREITKANAAGDFAFHGIPAGRYSMEVQSKGFALYQRGDLEVTGAAPVRADVALGLGKISETMVVSAPGTPRAQVEPAGPRVRIRIGGMVQAAKLLRMTKPQYPADLQADGAEGTVLLTAVVSKEGEPTSLRAQNTSVNPEFVNAAMDAVKQWRYQPVLLNGEPVEALTSITVDFKLQP